MEMTYPNTWSISSSVFPFVSGRRNQTNKPPATHHAEKKMYVPHSILSSMGGVMKAIMKLFIQFDEALIVVPLARMLRGKISAIVHQLAGPQEYAKLTI